MQWDQGGCLSPRYLYSALDWRISYNNTHSTSLSLSISHTTSSRILYILDRHTAQIRKYGRSMLAIAETVCYSDKFVILTISIYLFAWPQSTAINSWRNRA